MADPNVGATVINGKDGTGDVTIATVSYKFTISMFRLAAVVEMTVSDVFSNEGTADQDPGREQLQFEMMGLLKKNSPQSGPLIPPPQNVAMVFQYSASCTISGNFNFTRATADRLVNANGVISGAGLSKLAYVVAWDQS